MIRCLPSVLINTWAEMKTSIQEAGFYNYLVVNMHPGKIVPDCMNFWAETEFLFNDSVDNLISHMIYKGMLMYFTEAMLPDYPDSLKWGFRITNLNI